MRISNLARILSPVCLLAVSACGSNSPRTHAVSGRIELQGGQVAQLAGSTLEVASTADPTLRGFGQIQEDGRFVLNSIQGGELRSGVREGAYTARIIPNDEDGETRKRAASAVPPRYLKFETSGIHVQVPVQGELMVQIAAK